MCSSCCWILGPIAVLDKLAEIGTVTPRLDTVQQVALIYIFSENLSVPFGIFGISARATCVRSTQIPVRAAAFISINLC
jgi:hypothetical protein